ncbi:MAG: PadR family transcriptional regulator [Propionibacteriaceae bacterium]
MGVPLRRTPALLDVCAILQATPEPVWGLKIVRESGRPTGTVYPLLERLERAGYVESRWDDSPTPGPRRRMFVLTSAGESFVAQSLRDRTRRPQRVGQVVAV